MSTAIHAARRSKLTSYEAEQVRRIAQWKSEAPNPLAELWKRLTLPAARAVEKVLPDRLVRGAITRAYDASEWPGDREAVERRAGVPHLEELLHKPLEVCDRLSVSVGTSAELLAAVEGAATGAGGVLTTFLDVPLLFVLGLRTARRIGHCYGYPLEHHKDRHFVLGVMIAAMAGSLELRRERINRLRELEDLLIEEIQEDVIIEEALSFLFQLEIFEGIPGVGAISGAVFNWLFMERLEETARMVFQERWLRDNGKVERIEPAEVHQRHLAPGWAGTFGRLAYSGGYGLGFGVVLPVYALASIFRTGDNALTRGLRDGAAAAVDRADALAAWARGSAPPAVDGREGARALAPS